MTNSPNNNNPGNGDSGDGRDPLEDFDEAIQALRDTGGTCLLMDGDRSEGTVFGMRPEHLRPGRGWFIRRGRRPRLCQVAAFTALGS